jgi:hypothetical protein
VDDEREAHNQEAWERYLEAERREVEMRKDGHPAKQLGGPQPTESAADLERCAREDKERAELGLVQLRQGDHVWWRHVDELTENDRMARLEAERVLTGWLMDRQARRSSPQVGSW